ncbi:hypothetical protein JKF63_04761 [Porcisia hertigi]|uniref:Uncharacterized protein n=1 Tax=Porcisia hertigi TaxID=2761500 RepID=A0A836I466_9TRYP|nr:hypothetical protein JKF63_04761 [Porcisia hertigi]
MWDPRSYIAEAVGSKFSTGASVALPSFSGYTNRLLFLENEKAQLNSKIASERVAWKSKRLTLWGKDYTISCSADGNAEELLEQLEILAASIADEVTKCDSLYSGFVDHVDRIKLESKWEAADASFKNDSPVDKSYIQEVYLGFQLRERLCVPATVMALLIERESFHYLIKGDGCTIPIIAATDSSGNPTHYEGITLESDTVCLCNGMSRRCNDGNSRCFVTVGATNAISCGAGLFAAETVIADEHVESVLKTLVDDRVLVFFCSIYHDGTVYMYEQRANDEAASAGRPGVLRDTLAYRAGVIRNSRNADAMHHLASGEGRMRPKQMDAFDRALNLPTLVGTTKVSLGPRYFEVVHRIALIGLNNGMVLFSVENDSPLHNNLLRRDDKVLLLDFVDEQVWRNGAPRQWLPPDKCQPFKTEAGDFAVPSFGQVSGALLFSTDITVSAGDSLLVIGKVMEVHPEQSSLCSPVMLCSKLLRYTPFACKFLHRQYGPIGFVGYSFFFLSTSPSIAIALLPLHVTEFVSSETDVDPATTLFFFNRVSGLFPQPMFPFFTDVLPLPLHQLVDEKASAVAGKVTGRLLQMKSLASESSLILMLAVGEVVYDGSDLLQFMAG